MSEFKEFPKMMRHPSAQPAVLSTIFRLGYKPQPGEVENPGKPATLPPVTVYDANQQAMYEAKGYIAEGGDGASFAAAQSAPPASYEFNEYPKWVGEHLVNSLDEEMALHGSSMKMSSASKSCESNVSSIPVKRKGGRPKGTKNKPKADRHMVSN